jgi:hypothetical protein
MPLRGRVGRHTQSGRRHCQNLLDDQKTVIDLFTRIPIPAGGAEGAPDGWFGRMVAGMASDALYGMISDFEDRYFPRQRSGFVDPHGKMLKRMEELAARASALAGEAPPPGPPPGFFDTYIDFQRRKVLDERRSKLFSPAEQAAFQPLVDMAVEHIDKLKNEQGLKALPWPVEMFGRAYVTKNKRPHIETDGTLIFTDTGTMSSETLPLPEMRYGQPVGLDQDITTGKLSALLLYAHLGECCRVPPYHFGGIRDLTQPLMLDPEPIRRD